MATTPHIPKGLIPYADLLERLSPHELGRLAGINPRAVHAVQTRLAELAPTLDGYREFADTLRVDELVRLSGAPVQDVAFWLRCRMTPPDRPPAT